MSDDDIDIGIGYSGSKWTIKVRPTDLNETTEKHGPMPKLFKQIVRDMKNAISLGDILSFPRIIFFCNTIAKAGDLAYWFRRAMMEDLPKITAYTQYMRLFFGPEKDWTKTKIIEHLKDTQDQQRLLFCTNAFGMGVNIPDFRLCIHYWNPDSIESYVQETGRLCRLGQLGTAVLFYPDSWRKAKKKAVPESKMDDAKVASLSLKDYVTGLAQSPESLNTTQEEGLFCRRQFIVELFAGKKIKDMPPLEKWVAPGGVCCDECLLKAKGPY